jgi:hypothetical protein
LNATASHTGKPSLGKIALMYAFCASMALYPPLAGFVQPIILLSFVLIITAVAYGIAFQDKAVNKTLLFPVVGVLTLVYAGWFLIAALHGNNLIYATQDSLGFVIYLITPILYIFIKSNGLQQAFASFINHLCILIAGISLAIVLWYYISFGEVESGSLIAMNAVISSLGLNWMIDNNAGFLGLYTYTGHFLLLGVGLAFYNYCARKRMVYLLLIVLFGFGVLADGHRALVVSYVGLLLLLFPLYKMAFPPKKILLYSIAAGVALALMVLFNIDWILDRFNFSESDQSTMERWSQIPALLAKIMENPIFGNGFGSFARVIRNRDRPFYYEVDFLATIMKLGVLGTLMYFGSYLYMLECGRRIGHQAGYVFFSVGLAFLFYMGTNGGTAMSPDSAVFHMFLFILIAIATSDDRLRWFAPLVRIKSGAR